MTTQGMTVLTQDASSLTQDASSSSSSILPVLEDAFTEFLKNINVQGLAKFNIQELVHRATINMRTSIQQQDMVECRQENEILISFGQYCFNRFIATSPDCNLAFLHLLPRLLDPACWSLFQRHAGGSIPGPEVTFTSHDVQYGDHGSNVRFMKPLFRQNTMLRQCLDQEVSKSLFKMLETEKAVDMEDEVIVGTKSMAPALPAHTSAPSSQSEQLGLTQAQPPCTKTAINVDSDCTTMPAQHKVDVPPVGHYSHLEAGPQPPNFSFLKKPFKSARKWLLKSVSPFKSAADLAGSSSPLHDDERGRASRGQALLHNELKHVQSLDSPLSKIAKWFLPTSNLRKNQEDRSHGNNGMAQNAGSPLDFSCRSMPDLPCVRLQHDMMKGPHGRSEGVPGSQSHNLLFSNEARISLEHYADTSAVRRRDVLLSMTGMLGAFSDELVTQYTESEPRIQDSDHQTPVECLKNNSSFVPIALPILTEKFPQTITYSSSVNRRRVNSPWPAERNHLPSSSDISACQEDLSSTSKAGTGRSFSEISASRPSASMQSYSPPFSRRVLLSPALSSNGRARSSRLRTCASSCSQVDPAAHSGWPFGYSSPNMLSYCQSCDGLTAWSSAAGLPQYVQDTTECCPPLSAEDLISRQELMEAVLALSPKEVKPMVALVRELSTASAASSAAFDSASAVDEGFDGVSGSSARMLRRLLTSILCEERDDTAKWKEEEGTEGAGATKNSVMLPSEKPKVVTNDKMESEGAELLRVDRIIAQHASNEVKQRWIDLTSHHPGYDVGLRMRSSVTYGALSTLSTLNKLPSPEDEDLMTLLSRVDDWQLDMFALEAASGGHALSLLSFLLIKRTEAFRLYNLDETKLTRFLLKIEDGYPKGELYHCSTHAADVLRTMYVLCTRGGVWEGIRCSHLGVLAMLLSAVVHDYEHKGVNNDFLIKQQDELSVRYNDHAPLENHHISAAWSLLNQDQYNFLQAMPQRARVSLRKMMIEMVLGTDMKQHFSLTSLFVGKAVVATQDHVDHVWENNNAKIATRLGASPPRSPPRRLTSSSMKEMTDGQTGHVLYGQLQYCCGRQFGQQDYGSSSPTNPTTGSIIRAYSRMNSALSANSTPEAAGAATMISGGGDLVLIPAALPCLSTTTTGTSPSSASMMRPAAGATGHHLQLSALSPVQCKRPPCKVSTVRDIGGHIILRRAKTSAKLLSAAGSRRKGKASNAGSPLLLLPSHILHKCNRRSRWSSLQDGLCHLLHFTEDHLSLMDDRHSSVTAGRSSKQLSVGMMWDEESRVLVMKMVLKWADIGHIAGSWDVHRSWLWRLEEELFKQGDLERSSSLPVSPLMDRSSGFGVSKAQTGFFDVVAFPMYEPMAKVFPGCKPMLDAVKSNYDRWADIETRACDPA
ncbi:hypothetical protein CEUSTIGMA_g2767.t1 [Chlamydomonas eustigma]|uniref:Phosphodiesterase n=1 Tax=Chlamydomonas eustigma TaxID=1157962 RepID=A0A250WXH2_9CHLO|nr:hypothetical protein CEUSTIGMA_g2767.t1 [Chlamydomonas eustigma]|eukprot:GAX75322.1 hypothetical protein CEUSTIGMA_g2767.t1 [Chlamydomonas eustigma]